MGNADTKLPDGLWVRSCLDRGAAEVQARMDNIQAALSYIPEYRLANFEAWLWCDPGEHAFRITYDPFERRFRKDFRGIP